MLPTCSGRRPRNLSSSRQPASALAGSALSAQALAQASAEGGPRGSEFPCRSCDYTVEMGREESARRCFQVAFGGSAGTDRYRVAQLGPEGSCEALEPGANLYRVSCRGPQGASRSTQDVHELQDVVGGVIEVTRG